MLKTTIEEEGSDTQSQKDAYQKIRREIATSSDIIELQTNGNRGGLEIEKEAETAMNQQEQMAQEKQMIDELARTGVIFAYETALLAAAKKKDLKATELLEFVAKKIENFGRQWESGYINKERYLSPTRKLQRQPQHYDTQSEAQETNYGEYDITINQDEWEGEIAEAWPSPTSQSYDENGSTYGIGEEDGENSNNLTPGGIAKLQAIHRGNQDRERLRQMHVSALKIQTLARGNIARKNLENVKKQREEALKAREALHAERAKLAEEAAKLAAEKAKILEEAAALAAEKAKIEAEKADVEAKKREQEKAKQQAAAATKIQALHRGSLGRKKISDMHTDATKVQSVARGHAARKHAKQLKAQQTGKEPDAALEKKPKRKKKKIYKSKNKLPLSKVKDYIAGMYEKKVKADMVDDKKGNERDTLEEFCDDFFSQMFGMPALAGKKRYELEQGVKRYQKDDEFVRWYGTLIGWLDEDVHEGIITPYKEEAIDAYLYVMSKVFNVDAIEETLDDDPCLIKYHDFKVAIETLFKNQRNDEQIKKLEAEVENTIDDECVEFEFSFDLLMRTWYEYPEPIACPKLPKEDELKKKTTVNKKGGGKGGRKKRR